MAHEGPGKAPARPRPPPPFLQPAALLRKDPETERETRASQWPLPCVREGDFLPQKEKQKMELTSRGPLSPVSPIFEMCSSREKRCVQPSSASLCKRDKPSGSPVVIFQASGTVQPTPRQCLSLPLQLCGPRAVHGFLPCPGSSGHRAEMSLKTLSKPT